MDRLHGGLNERQEKVLLRVLAEGPGDLTGGSSAGNDATITGALALNDYPRPFRSGREGRVAAHGRAQSDTLSAE